MRDRFIKSDNATIIRDPGEIMSTEFTISVDARNMRCPLPILKMIRAIDAIEIGQSLELIATDPTSVADVNDWCGQNEHELLSERIEGGEYFFYVKKTH